MKVGLWKSGPGECSVAYNEKFINLLLYYSSAAAGTVYIPFFQQPEIWKILAHHLFTNESLAFILEISEINYFKSV